MRAPLVAALATALLSSAIAASVPDLSVFRGAKALEVLQQAGSAARILASRGAEPPSTLASVRVAEFSIDLDQPPAHRYDAIVPAFSGRFQPLLDFLRQFVTPAEFDAAVGAMGLLHAFLPSPYREEIAGIAQAASLPVGVVTVMNVFYELTAGCTSIVAEQVDPTGATHILHGRNLDYGVPGLRAMEVQLKFTRGGRVQYTGTTYLGYVGLLTGMRAGGFSVSVDERMTGASPVVNFIEAALAGGQFLGFFLRDMLEQEASFASALSRAQRTPLASVSYIILGGVAAGEGAVVTRDRSGPADTWLLDAAAGRWYLVETNYDHWKPVPPTDDRRGASDERNRARSSLHGLHVPLRHVERARPQPAHHLHHDHERRHRPVLHDVSQRLRRAVGRRRRGSRGLKTNALLIHFQTRLGSSARLSEPHRGAHVRRTMADGGSGSALADFVASGEADAAARTEKPGCVRAPLAPRLRHASRGERPPSIAGLAIMAPRRRLTMR